MQDTIVDIIDIIQREIRIYVAKRKRLLVIKYFVAVEVFTPKCDRHEASFAIS